MYRTKIDISGLDDTATSNIALIVAEDVRGVLGIRDRIHVTIGNNKTLPITKGSNGSDKHIPDILNEELKVEYVEDMVDGYEVSLTAYRPTGRVLYKDADIRSYIRPILTRRKMAFTITYAAKSKSAATAMVNRLRLKGPSDLRVAYHDLEYFYYIPYVVIELLDNINTLKNTYLPTPLDLDTYIDNTFNNSVDFANSHTGDLNKSQLVIRDKQMSVIGTMDTDPSDITKEFDEGTNRWEVNIEYSIEYELPTRLEVAYPIAVYNQPIDSRFMLEDVNLPVKGAPYTRDTAAMQAFADRTPYALTIPANRSYLAIPKVDTMELKIPQPGYVRLLSIFTIVSPNDPTHAFYLDEIPGISFKPDILELIKLEAGHVGTLYESLFNFTLFNFESRVYDNQVVLTPVTEVVNNAMVDRIRVDTTLPMDMSGNYRISIEMLSDLTMLMPNMLKRLTSNIATVDANSNAGFSVIDSVLGVLDLDTSLLSPGFDISRANTSLEIAMNVNNNLWELVHTKTKQLSLVEIFNVNKES